MTRGIYVPGRDGDRLTGQHRVVLRFDDGVYADLVCPEEGSCEDADRCGNCGRLYTDLEALACGDCLGIESQQECWLKTWFDNLMPEELLHGKLEVSVDVRWEDDHPVVTICEDKSLAAMRERGPVELALSDAHRRIGELEGERDAASWPGVIQGWRERAERAEAERDEAIRPLRILANPENWLDNPLSQTATLLGHDTPYELAVDALAHMPSNEKGAVESEGASEQ